MVRGIARRDRLLRQYVMIRDAMPSELAEVGQVRLAAYRSGGHLPRASGYTPTLAALGTAGDGQVLVAVDGGQVLGTVMLQSWPHAEEVAAGPGEAVIRALAVAPGGHGRGVGRALLTAVIDRARGINVRHLVLCTQPGMRAAQHLYEQAGFTRLPDRDWSPGGGKILLAYGMYLAARDPAGARGASCVD